ncbi:hypothetical protein PC113_g19091 [Phytophthora cactorum]|uniref:Uncharacterized protein n=1 Tax=Phytophthora cactorum TaxID=29920 RepID=A0A8T0YHK3_9STRA|nr:hypothetical protein PC113_g19091 [Phytophthora cactorum]
MMTLVSFAAEKASREVLGDSVERNAAENQQSLDVASGAFRTSRGNREQ